LADDANRQGWRLVSVSEHLDTGTAAGEFTLTILAALAQLERKQIGERTTTALARVAREGRVRSRYTLFGWRNADGETAQRKGDRRCLVKDSSEQEILTRILAHRATGLGARRIARKLSAEETPNPRTHRCWSPELVASILRNHAKRSRALARPIPFCET
jgi:site-specific DNA recombinase